jgi:hypothetical protein
MTNLDQKVHNLVEVKEDLTDKALEDLIFLDSKDSKDLIWETSEIFFQTFLEAEWLVDKVVDALVVDKLAYCASMAGCSPVLWPFYVVSDMRAFELFARGKSKDDYPAFEFD